MGVCYPRTVLVILAPAGTVLLSAGHPRAPPAGPAGIQREWVLIPKKESDIK